MLFLDVVIRYLNWPHIEVSYFVCLFLRYEKKFMHCNLKSFNNIVAKYCLTQLGLLPLGTYSNEDISELSLRIILQSLARQCDERLLV